MRNLTLFLLSLISISCKQESLTKFDSFVKRTDSLLTIKEKKEDFMGSLYINSNNKIYEKSIGFEDVDLNKKINSDTKYNIGSISKTYTAVLIMKAIEEKKLQLNGTIQQYFPVLKNAEKITIKHLLQHRSGVHNFTRDEVFWKTRTQNISSEKILSRINKYNNDFEPGSKTEYSNSNYFLLSMILERVYETSYEDLLQHKICSPLNLKNTYAERNTNKYCHSYTYKDKWIKFNPTSLSIGTGSGSIISTIKETNYFLESLLKGKVVTKNSLNEMKTIKNQYGLGLIEYTINNRKGYGHRGHIDEFRSTAIYFPNENLSFTMISNGSKEDMNILYQKIFKLYFNDTTIKVDSEKIKHFVGTYKSTKNETDPTVFINENNSLVLVIKNEFKEPLIYKGNNQFIFEQLYAENIKFTFTDNGQELLFEQGTFQGEYVKDE
ncbi:D-alanyl-D-alanine carboxypeptidase [Tenacibaculum sp. MAR_2009_124]|uniref:serine hydrolase domain-containing protein n=1 Tax=Tenacibaculum sp. MAR_2009_124 TaxID=1250059 RepID=UPI00089C83E1|nr:serine hydrolase domain-containing protein [Tenacibaculum sp. MAR_2009_124]SEB35956.1 D-alanyl-D-alanine carboxypeptidase [Tenacibaculum sp. MAR_2009_124]